MIQDPIMTKRQDVFLFYASHSGNAERRVQQTVERVIGTTEVYRTLHSLSARLKHSLHDIIGAVLVIHDVSELECMIGMSDLLADLSLVLLIRENGPQIVRRCHHLHPRLVDHLGGSEALDAVLRALCRRHMTLRENGFEQEIEPMCRD